jgi:hypothetical protein
MGRKTRRALCCNHNALAREDHAYVQGWEEHGKAIATL